MNSPDRSSTVRAFYAEHPEYFQAERHDETRRASLPALIAHLEATHPSDRGQWGVLVKTDRNNKIPCDVLVWRDTLDHFDVCDSSQGIWIGHGSIRINGGDAWFWAPASVVDPGGEERALQAPPYDVPSAPGPTPPPAPPPAPADLDALRDEMRGLHDSMATSFAAQTGEIAALQALVQQLIDRPVVPPDVKVPKKFTGRANINRVVTFGIDLVAVD